MRLAALDTETYAVRPGLAAPPLVCVSWADDEGSWVRGGAEDEIEAAVAHVRRALEDPTQHIGGCNLAYDLAVLTAHDNTLGTLIFSALDAGRLHSTDILEALHDSARGLMLREASGSPIFAYSQELLERRYLGLDRKDAKHGQDSWRLRYGELDGIPTAEWPMEARQYPIDDAEGALALLKIQLATDRQNKQCEAAEVRAAYALQLLSCRGIRTDVGMVARVVGDLHKRHEESRRQFFASGLVRVKTADRGDVLAGKVDDIPDAWLADQAVTLRALAGPGPGLEWVGRRLEDLTSARKALARGKSLRYATDTKRLAELVQEAYQGDAPPTDTGRVSTSRDTLDESGNELLEEYADAGPGEKHLAAFAGVLKQGMTVPINPSINVLVATQRVSMRAPNLMQLPRGGGIRECFVPRGFSAPHRADRMVLLSVDYGGLELATLAQVCYTLFGHSAMREALNLGRDLHLQLAGSFKGLTYEQAQALRKAKDKTIGNLRQAAKPVNFGLPGLMGPAKLVLTARKQGVRFCELAGLSHKCATNPKVTRYKGRPIPPTCTVCLELATEYREVWRRTWPEMVDYLDLTVRLAEACERGEPFPSFGDGMLRLETSANAASNHFFQNLAAQGAKRALYRLTREARTDRSSVLWRSCYPVVFIHDEIIAEVREDVAQEVAQRVSAIMVDTMRELTPDVAVTAPPAFARRWFKGMEDVRDSRGRMRPWWPPDGSPRKGGETESQWLERTWGWAPDREMMLADLQA